MFYLILWFRTIKASAVVRLFSTGVILIALSLNTACRMPFLPGYAAGYPQTVSSSVSNLAVLKDYKAARVSSEDREGNRDFMRIPPEKTMTIAALTGPGEVTHIWMTVNTEDDDYLRTLVLRVYYDGNHFPSVETPLGDFFGLGHGKMYYFNNAVQAIGTKGGMNSFWPMPFRKSCRIEIANQSRLPVDSLYFYIDWRKLKSMPYKAAYLHAQYRQEFPCPEGEPYLILDTGGARGHYVGVNLSIHTQVWGWWGEGDDIFTIDGETIPSLWGTGSEDYFCGAWCYGETFFNEYFGMPYRELQEHPPDNYWNVYRYHIENPVSFRRSLRVEIEHGANGFDNTRKDGWNNNYSSVAYWYMEKPVPLRGVLPPASKRVSPYRPLPIPDEIIEPQYWDIATTYPAVNPHVQDMGTFKREDRQWSFGDHVFCQPNIKGSLVHVTFELDEASSGPMVMSMTQAPDYGRVKISLDGQTLISAFNAYAPVVRPALMDFGAVELSAGKHTLTFETIDKDPRSSNYYWGFDYCRLGGAPLDIEKNNPVYPVETE